MLRFKKNVFAVSRTPSNAFSDSAISHDIYFDLAVLRMSDYAWKTNFWCDILMDGLITNQIALHCSPLVGERSSVKVLGLTAGDSFSPHSLPPLAHPSLLLHNFLLTPGVFLRSGAFDLRLEKERKRLLRLLRVRAYALPRIFTWKRHSQGSNRLLISKRKGLGVRLFTSKDAQKFGSFRCLRLWELDKVIVPN